MMLNRTCRRVYQETGAKVRAYLGTILGELAWTLALSACFRDGPFHDTTVVSTPGRIESDRSDAVGSRRIRTNWARKRDPRAS